MRIAEDRVSTAAGVYHYRAARRRHAGVGASRRGERGSGDEAVDASLAHRAYAATGAASDTLSVERGALRQTLERHRWNTDAAARELGVHRATLYRRMKRLRLIVPSLEASVLPEAPLSLA